MPIFNKPNLEKRDTIERYEHQTEFSGFEYLWEASICKESLNKFEVIICIE